jgi:hypothetical protein
LTPGREPNRLRRGLDPVRIHWDWVEASSIAVILLVAVLLRFPTFQQPLVEAHAFRQTQTAYTARIFHEQGIDLLHPELPVLGEPWEIPFEFPLFQAVASVPMALGLTPDTALRLTGFVTFLITAGLVWGLVRYVTRRPLAAAAALVAFSFSPFALLWSRTSLIEYLATAGALGFAFSAIVWWETRRWWWAGLAIVSGTIGMLVKPTTAAFWVVPILGWAAVGSDSRERAHWARSAWRKARRVLTPGLLAVVSLPFLAAFIWTRHADAIKAASSTTDWLTESALRTWTYGTIAQRLDIGNWLFVFGRGSYLLLGPIIWGVLLLLPLFVAERRAFWIGVALTGILPVAIFFNLYVAHDYYLAAISPPTALLLGAGTGWMHQQLRRRFGSVAGTAGIAVLGTVWLASTLLPALPYWRTAYARIDRSTIAAEVPDVTAPEDRLIVAGLDWSPHLLYYASRRGLMLTPHLDPLETIAEARRRGYEYFVSLDPASDPIHLIRGWPWIGVVGEHVYRLGEGPAGVVQAAVVASSDVREFTRLSAIGQTLTGEPLSLKCGVPHYLPRGGVATWIQITAEMSDAVRIWIDYGLAPVPNVRMIVVRTGDPQIPLTLMCSGVDSIVVESMVSGPMLGHR